MKNKLIRLKNILHQRLVTLCGWIFKTLKCFKLFQTISKWNMWGHRPYKMLYELHLNVYILLLPTMFLAHPTFHLSKLKLFHKYKKNKDKKQAYHLGFDTIEHRFASEVECTMGAKQTRSLGKQYHIKWKWCHLKGAQCVKLNHLNNQFEMPKKLKLIKGMKWSEKNSQDVKTYDKGQIQLKCW